MPETDRTKDPLHQETAVPQCEKPQLQTGKFAKKKYQAVFEQSSDALILIDIKTGRKVEYNDRACGNLGYTREEFRDIRLEEITTSYALAKTKEQADSLFSGPVSYETEARCKNGETLNVLVRAQLITVDAGETCLLVQWTDITRQKQAEKLLNEKQQKLEDTVTTLKTLVKTFEQEKKEIEESVLSKFKDLVEPYFKKLAEMCTDPEQKIYLDIILTNLKEFGTYRSENISAKYPNLTSTEAQIANLIKHGKGSKEISNIMHVSISTVDFHRKNIRQKLGLHKKNDRLKDYLLSVKD